MADLGTDISCTDDIDPGFKLVSGRTALGQAIYHRLITPKGSLKRHPEYGYDITSFLNDDDFSPFQIAAGVEAQVERDERVQGCECAVDYDSVTKKLSVSLRITDSLGPFDLIVNVSEAGPELILPALALDS